MMTNNRRFVFDTNVLISAFLFSQSKPRQALVKATVIGVIYSFYIGQSLMCFLVTALSAFIIA